MGIPIADLLHALDGNFVFTEEKFQKRTVQQLKGTFAFSIKQLLHREYVEFHDFDALQSRLVEVKTHPLDIPDFHLPHDFHLSVEKEMIAFTILANAFFLSQNKFIKEKFSINVPNVFFHINLFSYENERIAWCGSHNVQPIPDQISSESKPF